MLYSYFVVGHTESGKVMLTLKIITKQLPQSEFWVVKQGNTNYEPEVKPKMQILAWIT